MKNRKQKQNHFLIVHFTFHRVPHVCMNVARRKKSIKRVNNFRKWFNAQESKKPYYCKWISISAFIVADSSINLNMFHIWFFQPFSRWYRSSQKGFFYQFFSFCCCWFYYDAIWATKQKAIICYYLIVSFFQCFPHPWDTLDIFLPFKLQHKINGCCRCR